MIHQNSPGIPKNMTSLIMRKSMSTLLMMPPSVDRASLTRLAATTRK